MNLQFVLVIYYLTLVRKLLVLVQTLIYIHSNIFFKSFQILKFLVAPICIRVHSPLFFCHFLTTILQMMLPMQFTTKSFHTKCLVLSHFITSQLQPFHSECPDPGHGTKIYVRYHDWFHHS